jgi:small-conductance mechanosensitive channel
MKTTQRIAAVVLLLLLAAAGYALWRSSPRENHAAAPAANKNAAAAPLVDQSPLITAQHLAQLADTPDEQALAREALRVSDHEVDLAFASALREAALHPPALSAEAKDIQARLQKAQKLLASDQAEASRLTSELAKAAGEHKDAVNEQLELLKAQMELDQDEVDDAKQDLIRAGGDPQARIQQMVQEHEETAHNTPAVLAPISSAESARGLTHRYGQWTALRQKRQKLERARAASESAAAVLTARHNALDAQIDEVMSASPGLKRSSAPGGAVAGALPTPDSGALLQRTKSLSVDQKELAAFDRRIDDHRELARIYAQWSELVKTRQLAVMRRALVGVIVILVIALIALFFNRWMEVVLGRLRLDRRQIQTLHTIIRVTLRVVAILLILLVIFGPPNQLGTFLGLAGAGLTVALKDFVVAFLGWFVLMGHHGIRLGDWVEINGVTGEVVEIGLFHTVLLETGNWTDSGHPTGRRVTFMNSYAIEGHYFNFSTTGQWLWDELRLVLPTGQDPYPIIAAIQSRTVEATRESMQQAQREWQHTAQSRDMSSFTAEPTINVKPVVGGIELSVRYIARANERYQLRAKLYQAAVELLGQKKPPSAEAPLKQQPSLT